MCAHLCVVVRLSNSLCPLQRSMGRRSSFRDPLLCRLLHVPSVRSLLIPCEPILMSENSLAFAMISNNVLILSLRAMLADFAWLMSIAVFW